MPEKTLTSFDTTRSEEQKSEAVKKCVKITLKCLRICKRKKSIKKVSPNVNKETKTWYNSHYLSSCMTSFAHLHTMCCAKKTCLKTSSTNTLCKKTFLCFFSHKVFQPCHFSAENGTKVRQSRSEHNGSMSNCLRWILRKGNPYFPTSAIHKQARVISGIPLDACRLLKNEVVRKERKYKGSLFKNVMCFVNQSHCWLENWNTALSTFFKHDFWYVAESYEPRDHLERGLIQQWVSCLETAGFGYS